MLLKEVIILVKINEVSIIIRVNGKVFKVKEVIKVVKTTLILIKNKNKFYIKETIK